MVYARIVLEPLKNNQSARGQPQKGEGYRQVSNIRHNLVGN